MYVCTYVCYVVKYVQVAEDFKTPLGPLNALTEAAKKPLGAYVYTETCTANLIYTCLYVTFCFIYSMYVRTL